MQAMPLTEHIGRAFLKTILWTVFPTPAAAYTGIRYEITFFFDYTISKKIGLPEYRFHTKVKILYLSLINTENNPDVSGISRIHI